MKIQLYSRTARDHPLFLLLKTAFILGSCLIQSCSSTPKHPSTGPDQDHGADQWKSQVENSSIDIQYTLGRDHHRFVAIAQQNGVTGNTYLEKQVLESGQIKQEKYSDFLKKALSFVQTVQKNAATPMPCRSSFTIKVRLGSDTQTARGCRSSDDGSLSKLVRDGEFLLYSKN